MLLPRYVDFAHIVKYEHQGIFCDYCDEYFCHDNEHTGSYHHFLTIISVDRRQVLARVLGISESEVDEEFFILWEDEDAPLDSVHTYDIYSKLDSSDDGPQVHVKFVRDHTATVEKLRAMYAEFTA